MNMETARILSRLTADFYAAKAGSFSATRQSSWPGWERLAEFLDEGAAPLAVADVACGNGRFLKFLHRQFPQRPISYDGWDSNGALLAEAAQLADGLSVSAEFTQCNLVDMLLGESGDLPGFDGPSGAPELPGELPRAPEDSSFPLFADSCPAAFDLVACFGFFHHVPGQEARRQLLHELLALARPGGLVAVSLWRFADHAPLREKAQRSTEEALGFLAGNGGKDGGEIPTPALDSGDFLLGWNQAHGHFRYCHSFSDEEIDRLVESASPFARLQARYQADGRTGALNSYLVFSAI